MNDRQLQRFLPKIAFRQIDDDFAECWVWTASRTIVGYGKFSVGGHDGGWDFAHRIAYEHWNGPIPEGHEIDHLCRVKACVNPRHLEAVLAKTNSQRGLAPIHMRIVGRSMRGRPVQRTPEHQAKLDAARRSDKYRERISATSRAYWARKRQDVA